jgi:hypothetical protein
MNGYKDIREIKRAEYVVLLKRKQNGERLTDKEYFEYHKYRFNCLNEYNVYTNDELSMIWTEYINKIMNYELIKK